MKLPRLFGCTFLAFAGVPLAAQQELPRQDKVVVDEDGTVHVPAQEVPLSSFLSPEAKSYVTQHLWCWLMPVMVTSPSFGKAWSNDNCPMPWR